MVRGEAVSETGRRVLDTLRCAAAWTSGWKFPERTVGKFEGKERSGDVASLFVAILAALMCSGLSGIGSVRAEGGPAIKPTITGGTDGARFAGSHHPSRDAIDLRTWNLNRRQGAAILQELRKRLGSEYDVIDARGREGGFHFHVEYDPAHGRPARTADRADAGPVADRPGAGISLPSTLTCIEGAARKVEKRPDGDLSEFRGDRDLSSSGDFDGDGEMDEAFFVEHEGKIFLLACLDRNPEPFRLAGLSGVGNYGIWTASPRVHVAACARGYGSGCGAGELSELELDVDAIGLYDFERSSRIHYWSVDRFGVFWLSD